MPSGNRLLSVKLADLIPVIAGCYSLPWHRNGSAANYSNTSMHLAAEE